MDYLDETMPYKKNQNDVRPPRLNTSMIFNHVSSSMKVSSLTVHTE